MPALPYLCFKLKIRTTIISYTLVSFGLPSFLIFRNASFRFHGLHFRALRLDKYIFLRILAGASGVLAVNSVEWEKGTGIVMEQYKLGEMEQLSYSSISFFSCSTSFSLNLFLLEKASRNCGREPPKFSLINNSPCADRNSSPDMITRTTPLSEKEVEQLKKLIEEYET